MNSLNIKDQQGIRIVEMNRPKALNALNAEMMDAQTCKETGLALSVVPNDKLLEEAHNRATTLASLPLVSLLATKALLMDPLRDQIKAAMRKENTELDRLTGAPANREAVRAFHKKREPDFNGL